MSILPVNDPRRRSRIAVRLVPWALLLAAAACVYYVNSHQDLTNTLDGPYPPKLSAWHLFTATRDGLKPNTRVIPFDLNTPLFSDYASKYRFVRMPEGKSARYSDDSVFEFPIGTVFAKSFAFPIDGQPGKERLIETRLLVRSNSAWVALPYIWNDRQSEAYLQLVPDPVPVKFTDVLGQRHDFTYQIPNANECALCHDHDHQLQPIGPKARNLNKDYAYADGTVNQLVRWTQLGYLQDAPAPNLAPRAAVWNNPASGWLEDRALAYLDNNCAHCHQPGGSAGYTGVDFRLGHPDSLHAGFCKHPNSAGNMDGRQYDIVPGDPQNSILVYRLASTAPKIMMPQIGRATVHSEGLALIQSWVAGLPPRSCAM